MFWDNWVCVSFVDIRLVIWRCGFVGIWRLGAEGLKYIGGRVWV